MKVYGGVKIWLHSFLIWELSGRIVKLQVKVAVAVEERTPCAN
jgi:hypothetical protein